LIDRMRFWRRRRRRR